MKPITVYRDPAAAVKQIREELILARKSMPETSAPSPKLLKYIAELEEELVEAKRQLQALIDDMKTKKLGLLENAVDPCATAARFLTRSSRSGK